MKTTKLAIIAALALSPAVLSDMGLGSGNAALWAQAPPPVPAAYQDLYNTLNTQITSFESQVPGGGNYATNFSAELMSANANKGPGLLSTPYSSVVREMDSLKALGVKALTVAMHFPVLYPAYYQNPSDYQQYLNFYTQVAQDVRARGLKLVVSTGVILPGFSSVDFTAYYSSLTLNQYEQGRMQEAAIIAQQIKPDFLTVVEEPDVEAVYSGHSELGTVSGSMGLLNLILAGLQQAGISGLPVGAGVGTWIPTYATFIQSYVTTPVQYIDMHVFPVNRDFMTRVINIANIAQPAGKGLAISQAWCYKARDSELEVLTFTQIEERDPFSFWGPVDIQFLQALVNFSRYEKLSYFSPFYSPYFHSYLDYNAVSTVPPDQLPTLADNQAGQSIMAGQYTPTGQAYSAMILNSPDLTPPSSPTGLAATAKTTSAIHVTWNASTDNVGVAGYQVYRNGSLLGTTSGTDYFDQNLSPSTTYSYSVTAYDVAGNKSAAVGPVFGTTLSPPDTTPPTVPANLIASAVSFSQVNLSWTASTDDVAVTGYQIYRGSSANSLTAFAMASSNFYTDTGLNPSTAYYYAVLAYDAKGNKSALSSTASATTPQEPPPSVPTHLAVTSLAWNQVNLSWSPSTSSTGMGGYVVYRGTTQSNLALFSSLSTTTFVDTNVGPSTAYYYAVAAFDTRGLKSAPSSSILATTPTEPAPTVPQNLSITSISWNQVSLSWSPSTSSAGVGGYVVYRGTSLSSLIMIGSISATAYADTNVAPSTLHYYTVAAYDEWGVRSAQSNSVSLTTPVSPPPSVPTGLSAQAISTSQVNLTWSPSTSTAGLGGYLVYRGTSPSALNMLANTPTTYYSDTRAVGSTTYYYAVVAYDKFGSRSAQSGPVSARTP